MHAMKILAVDTTSESGSAAILDGDVLRAMVGFSKKPGYAEKLLPTVEQMLEELSLELSDIDGFAVAAGPGSFTGLRIGIATMEGLSYATRRPVVGISSLEATAHRYRFVNGWVAPILDARRKEVFGALYEANGRELKEAVAPVCEPAERFLARLPKEPVLVAGTATLVFRELLSHESQGHLQSAAPSFFLAEEVARLGSERIQKGASTLLGSLEAIYLRPSDAEKARQTKLSSAGPTMPS
jgi:tRNA threonylcarbamoyladenosine biosynthesis protein TsaB